MEKRRIVIRNLSFQVDEEKLTDYFKNFGEIVEVRILRLENGRPKGVAFVQFKNTLSALKAINDCNMKEFMGRPIAVDLAVPQDKYKLSLAQKSTKTKTENKRQEVRNEYSELPQGAVTKTLKDVKDEKELVESDSEFSNENDDSDRIQSGYSEDDDDDSEVEGEESKPGFASNPVSRDVLDGKTLFLRNVSVEASEEQIKDLLSRFGELKHVFFCHDKATGMFRGSAFAQFLAKETADACLEAYSDPLNKSQFKLGGRSFYVNRAVAREDLQKKSQQKKNEPNDKRNLFLAREGVIREGTQGSKGVSKSDLALRVQMEIVKRKMLTNLSIFVSPVRLFVCNLPLHVTDEELRNLFKNHSPRGAVITESKIMRNLYELDDSGKAVSKGYGFVTFAKHKHALETLRNINNNPSIFTSYKRPVVEFSLENKSAIKAKANRLQNSKNKNVQRVPELGDKENLDSTKEKPSFMGSSYDLSRKGVKALHSHIGPKVRHRDRKGSKKEKKITRNKVNNQMRNSRGMKRKREASKFIAQRKFAKNKKLKRNSKSRQSRQKTDDSTKKPKSTKKKFI